MNAVVNPAMLGITCAAMLWLSLLWVGARLKIGAQSVPVRLAFGVAAGLALFVPLAGRPAWSWAFGFCPNPSLPLLGLVCAGLWRHLCGITVFSPAEWRTAWTFGAVAGSVLYLHPFCISADLYYWGGHDGVVAWTIAGLAVLFLSWGNRMGVLFIAALVGFEVRALESHNGWDYIVDPFYWLTSCSILLAQVITSWLERRRRHSDNKRREPFRGDARISTAVGYRRAHKTTSAVHDEVQSAPSP